MKLKGVEFGNVLGASGVQGFFGEGYWFHKPWKPLGLDFSDVTLVSKTATLSPREPERSPVRIQFLRGNVLNAYGLKNPGLPALLDERKWQNLSKPFFISLAPMASSANMRLEEIKVMTDYFRPGLFKSPFGLEINLSCPNTDHSPAALLNEAFMLIWKAAEQLKSFRSRHVPLVPKFSIASASPETIRELEDHPDCDAICISNTIPFGWPGLDWKKVWGSKYSPLSEHGGGGLSGRELQLLACEWIARLRDRGFSKPIIGCGGILGPEDVVSYHHAGASAVAVGTVAILRPWRVKSIVKQANLIAWN